MLARMKKGLATGLALVLLVLAGGTSRCAAKERGEVVRAAELTWVRADGPADKAGLDVHDQVLAVNGVLVTDRPALLRTLAGLGNRAVLEVRSGRTGEVRRVVVRPDPHLGIHFKIVPVPSPLP
jgi:predicted metalloprotease with PDZ domain